MLEQNVPLKFQYSLREAFRDVVKDYVLQSQHLKRYSDKPLGYPGDFMMFELLYDGKPLSEGIGYYFDIFVLKY